jgi:hypothetical protein
VSATREKLFDTWAPRGSRWSRWAKPALFAQLVHRPIESDEASRDPYRGATGPWSSILTHWAPPPQETALVVDLPGRAAVDTGLALAARGYQPVPLFNVCTDVGEVIDQKPLLAALTEGAAYLDSLTLPPDAPPAFLLDARRQVPERPLTVGAFDNRWIIYPSDLPSARFFARQAIRRMWLIAAQEPASDVLDVFEGFLDGDGLELAFKDPAIPGPADPMRLERSPTGLGRWLRRDQLVQTMKPRLWLSRRGFGGRIEPPPSNG